MIRLYRSPDGLEGGGGEATATQEAHPMESFQRSFAESLAKTRQEVSTESTTAGKPEQASEKANSGEGAKDEDVAKAQSTTAETGKEEATGDGKGAEENAWAEEQQKFLKEHGIDGLDYSEGGQKLLQMLQDTKGQLDRVSGSNSNLLTRNSTIENLLNSGDVEGLKKMGYNLPEVQTVDKQIEDINGRLNGIVEALDPFYTHLHQNNPELAKAFQDVFNRDILSRYQNELGKLERQKEKSEWMREAKGVKDPESAYKSLSSQAKANIADLTREDPKAAENYEVLKTATEPGGALHALGLSLAKIYGSGIETARYFNDIASAIKQKQSLPDILKAEKQRWEQDQAKRGKAPTSGNADSQGKASAAPGTGSLLGAAMKRYMGAK